MHPEAYAYVHKSLLGKDLNGKRVLEIGSLNVNGTVRPLFSGVSEYVGIDVRPGPLVDQVVDARDFDGSGFDIVVASESIEHDKKPKEVIDAALNALRPGGMLIITTSGPKRAPHKWDGSPHGGGDEPYQNFEAKELEKMLKKWDRVEVEEGRDGEDMWLVAYKPEASPVSPDETQAIAAAEDDGLYVAEAEEQPEAPQKPKRAAKKSEK